MPTSIITSPAISSFVGYFGFDVFRGRIMVPIADNLNAPEIAFRQEPLNPKNAAEFSSLSRTLFSEMEDLNLPVPFLRSQESRRMAGHPLPTTGSLWSLWTQPPPSGKIRFQFGNPVLDEAFHVDRPFKMNVVLRGDERARLNQLKIECHTKDVLVETFVNLHPVKSGIRIERPRFHLELCGPALRSLEVLLKLAPENAVSELALKSALYLGEEFDVEGRSAVDFSYDSIHIWHDASSSSSPAMASLWEMAFKLMHETIYASL
jgi:hypothetical protein